MPDFEIHTELHAYTHVEADNEEEARTKFDGIDITWEDIYWEATCVQDVKEIEG